MSENIILTIDKNKIATLTFDIKDKQVNILNSETMYQLNHHLDVIKANSDIVAMIVKSNKKNIFIAGADINEIKALNTKEETKDKLLDGHRIMSKIENLSIPTIAVVKGACLGGGLELALACDEIICSNDDKTILGQPEINLGIIPGFGGTIRLPKKIGVQKATDLILTGKPVDAKKAEKIGLVTKTFRPCFFDEQSYEWIVNKIKFGKKNKVSKKYLIDKSPIARKIFFLIAKKTVRKKTKGQYPAAVKAIEVIQKSYNKKLRKAIDIEIKGFTQLANEPVSNNLIDLFLNSEKVKKNMEATEKRDIKNVMIIGSGLMGSGIAWLFSYRSFKTFIKDINWKAVHKGLNDIRSIYVKLQRRKRWGTNQIKQFMNRVQGTIDNKGDEKMDFILEAATEDIAIKLKIFKDLEESNKNTIIATNTSSLSVNQMSQKLKNPERFIGMHFFSPANKMPLVEVIPGEKTNQETLFTVLSLCKTLNKIGIIVKDCPGFLINRILIPYVNEAIYCLQDGASITEIDHLMESFGMPIGPLALADEVGLDVGYKVANILEKGYGQRMKVSPLFNYIIESKKYLGKKNKQGFYIHGKDKVVNPAITKLVKAKNLLRVQKDIHRDCLDRLILIMVNEASRCIEENVVKNHEELDLAVIMGTGFPPFRGGLCRYADQQGQNNIVSKLMKLKEKYGDRFTPSNLLIKMSDENKNFYVSK